MNNLELVKTLTSNVCESNNVDPNNLEECLKLAKKLNGIEVTENKQDIPPALQIPLVGKARVWWG